MAAVDIRDQSKVANAASRVDLENQNNYFDSSNKGVKVNKDSRRWSKRFKKNSNWTDNRTISVHYNNFSPPFPPPNNLPAAYIWNQSGQIQPNGPVVWNSELGGPAALLDHEQQQAQIQDCWIQTQSTIDALKKAIFDLQCRWLGSSDDSTKDIELSWSFAEEMNSDILERLKTAKKYYRRDYRRHDRVSSLLLRLEEGLPVFFRWVNPLQREHRCSLCSAVWLILSGITTTNNTKPQDLTIEFVAKSLSMFSYANDYLGIRDNVRGMMRETVEVFERFVILFTDVLVNDAQELQASQIRKTEAELEAVKTSLISANDRARLWNKDNPVPERSFPPAPTQASEQDVLQRMLEFLSSQIPPEWRMHHFGNNGISLTGMDQQSAEPVRKRNGKWSTSKATAASNATLSSGIGISEILGYLSYNADEAVQDVRRCMSDSQAQGPHMEQLFTLTRRPEFCRWIECKDDTQSSALLVHGNLEPDSFGLITPLSYLCAQLATQLYRRESVVVLSYFCGFHSRVRDKTASAASMMCWIISQLLSHPVVARLVDMSGAVVDRHYVKKIKQRGIEALCQLLKDVMRQLQAHKVLVFCLIDSISSYECGNRREDTLMALTALTSIVRPRRNTRSAESKMAFKLMVTDAARTQRAYNYFRPEERVNLEGVVLHGVDGPTGLKLI